jgi:hypothetical protein
VAGFDEGKLPKVMNEIIGMSAAIDVLSMLSTTNKSNSHSLGIDGMSQSISGQGPQVYDGRIKQLEEQRRLLMNKVKSLFQLNLISGTI